eukprot:NODE_5339_length_1028_cov_41.618785_g4771_i0.p1 GENE.NODE_5339_length_1028_cov_41.618785_g4771_i0~~NODE_5339_length_1028_cov_41.618785_g4771_i0.p1  ORF type:complete len:211 (+),score=29.14 NODE_5339_length_1028_cov_41.618785_g4771_i0:78-710(+)
MNSFQENCEKGEFYEAQFWLKSQLNRAFGQNRLDKVVDLIELGASTYLTHHQLPLAVEVSSYVNKMWPSASPEAISGLLARLVKLFQNNNADEECIKFLLETLRIFTKDSSNSEAASKIRSEIHYELALLFWRKKDYANSQRHFINTNLAAPTSGGENVPEHRAAQLSSMLHEWHALILSSNDPEKNRISPVMHKMHFTVTMFIPHCEVK